MDGATLANYALSYMGNIGIQQRPPRGPGDANNVTGGPQTGVGALDAKYPEIGIDGRPADTGAQQAGVRVRPEDAGAKIMQSVDGDTISISAEGQAYVQRTTGTDDARDTTSATARVEDVGSSFGQPFGQPFTVAERERAAETFFDLPQGGGIERADYEQPQIQQIQDKAEATQAEERLMTQLQPQEEEKTSAVEVAQEEETAKEEIDPSDFRQYFNSELRQMLYRGQITQQQYDKEIESRKTEDDLKIDKKLL